MRSSSDIKEKNGDGMQGAAIRSKLKNIGRQMKFIVLTKKPMAASVTVNEFTLT